MSLRDWLAPQGQVDQSGSLVVIVANVIRVPLVGRRNKGPKLSYDQRGGVIVISRGMLESMAYQSMPASAKVLMILLHMHWRNDRLVAYGVREAAQKIGCTPNTATKAFNILKDRGFIVCENESLFNSKTGSKAREWRLTWMPFEFRGPTHDWQKWEQIANQPYQNESHK